MASGAIDAPLLDTPASPWAPREPRGGSASKGDEASASDAAASETRVQLPVTSPEPRVPPGDHLESLDYEPVHNDVNRLELSRRRARRGRDTRRFYGYTGLTLAKSAIALVVGVCVGALAFAIDAAVDGVFDAKRAHILEHIHPASAEGGRGVFFPSREHVELLGSYVGACVALVTLASATCVFWAPQAAGGGVTGVMAFLNGSNVPDLLGFKALVAKVIGVTCAVGSSLAVGPEGPMVHVGAAVASCVVLAAPNRWLRDGAAGDLLADDDDSDDDDDDEPEPEPERPLMPYPRSEDGDRPPLVSRSKTRRDRTRETARHILVDLASHATRREFVSAGAAAGLAAAFGAPVGGVLFSLEEASTYWSRKVMWRSFVCASAASITLAMCQSTGNGGGAMFLDSSAVRVLKPRDYARQLPFFVATAVVGGVAGVAFNAATSFFARFVRPRHDRKRHRVLDCALVATLTVLTRFLAASYGGRCVASPARWAAAGFGERWTCGASGEVNDVASVLFGSPTAVIGRLLSMGELSADLSNGEDAAMVTHGFTATGLMLSAVAYLFLMAAAYGLAVPGGVFLPSVFLGACGGGAFGLLLRGSVPTSWDVQPGVYALIGATATLAGVFRSSVSLVAIMVEGTGGIFFAFPIIVAVAVSNATCAFFARGGEAPHAGSVYHLDLVRNEKVVFLPGEPPRAFKALAAKDLMCEGPVSTVRAEGETAARLARLLATSTHHGFPVVDENGRLIGLASRAQLDVLVATHAVGGQGARVGDAHAHRRVLDARMRVAHLTRRRARNGLDSERASASAVAGDPAVAGEPETEPVKLDVAGFMQRAPLCVHLDHPATRVHLLFTTLGLRHLCVVDAGNRVAGVITRKDVTRAESAASASSARRAA